jgi:hypothetical protein
MANKRVRRWHKLPAPVQIRIEELTDDFPSLTPSQIYKEMDAQGEDGSKKYKEIADYGLPDKRTVQSIVKQRRPPDPSGPWEPTEWGSGEDVVLVLDVIKHLGESSELIWPTRTEAERIRWIKQIAQTLPPTLAWRLTRRYLIYEAQQISTKRLAWYLAFRPWESEANKELYFKMVPESEWVMYPIEASGTAKGGGRISAE